MLCADDLVLKTSSLEEMQEMLDKPRVHADTKGLIVYTIKSQVVHFNSKSGSSLPTSTFDGVPLS